MRLQDWPRRLDVYFRDQSGKEFRYGIHDCCTFSCGAVFAMTGIDPAEGFRGKYQSRKQARAILREYGGLEKMLGNAGFRKIRVAEARRGDLAFVRQGLLGVVSLDGIHVLVVGDQGKLCRVPLSSASSAWRV
jgi:hypothetical protein